MIPFHLDKNFSNHIVESRSRWFVGSSNKSTSGSLSNIDARATLILQPPDKVSVVSEN